MDRFSIDAFPEMEQNTRAVPPQDRGTRLVCQRSKKARLPSESYQIICKILHVVLFR
jgi:hypothetical protein